MQFSFSFFFSNKKCPRAPFHLGHRHAARLSGALSSDLRSHGTQVLSPPLPTQTTTPKTCSCHEGTRGRGGTLRDGAADVMRLFEMVGAVSLRWDGTAHETCEGAGDRSLHGSLSQSRAVTGPRVYSQTSQQ